VGELRCHHAAAGPVFCAERCVQLGQAAIGRDVGAQSSVGREDLVEGLHLPIELREGLALLLVEVDLVQEPVELLVSRSRAGVEEAGRGLAHQLLEVLEKDVEVLDGRLHVLGVEAEGLVERLEDADEVDDEAARLLDASVVLVGPVDAGDSLEEDMVAHRLVEIHAVEDGGVVAGEQLVGDDEDPGQLGRLRERLAGILFAHLVDLVLGDERPVDYVVGVLCVDGFRPLGRQVLVERFLVLGAGLAVDGDQEGLVAERRDVFLEVLRHELGDLLDALVGLQEGLEADRPVQDAVEFVNVADALGLRELEELLLEHLVRDADVIRREGMAQLEGGAVFNGLGDRVLVEVALRVVGAEGLEGTLPLGRLVNRSAREADEGGRRQCAHQVVAKIAAGGPVRLVDEDEEVVAGAGVSAHALELVDHGDDEAAEVLIQERLKTRLGVRVLDLDVAPAHLADHPVDPASELALQLVAINDEENGGAGEAGFVLENEASGGDEGEGLA